MEIFYKDILRIVLTQIVAEMFSHSRIISPNFRSDDLIFADLLTFLLIAITAQIFSFDNRIRLLYIENSLTSTGGRSRTVKRLFHVQNRNEAQMGATHVLINPVQDQIVLRRKPEIRPLPDFLAGQVSDATRRVYRRDVQYFLHGGSVIELVRFRTAAKARV